MAKWLVGGDEVLAHNPLGEKGSPPKKVWMTHDQNGAYLEPDEEFLVQVDGSAPQEPGAQQQYRGRKIHNVKMGWSGPYTDDTHREYWIRRSVNRNGDLRTRREYTARE